MATKIAIRAAAIACAALCFVFGTSTRVAGQDAKAGEAEQAGPYGSMVIRDVTVIDGSGAPAFGPADVFVRGNRIVRVVPSDAILREESKAEAAHEAKPAAPDRVIDGKGMYLTPGLIDAHAHINESKEVPAEYIYKLYLGHGVTTVRTFNVGNGSPKEMVEEKKQIAANQIVAPRMYVYPFWKESDPRSSTVEGANQIVDEWHNMGVDGIKILGKPGLWRDIFQTITTRAKKYNMGVAVHIGQDGGIR